MNVIPEFVLERLFDDAECVSAVVALEIFDIFKQERFRFFRRYDAGNIEEQRSLRCAFKAVRPAERIFFADAGN